MSKGWSETWFGLFVVALGVLLAVGLGLWGYVNSTAIPLHPRPQDVPSVTRSETSPSWAHAVSQARQLARAGVSAQNLPGLSVAVGVGSDRVWAEGFGWADLQTRTVVTPDTQFRIGTASMVLTSVAVGLLLEQRLLALDDDIQARVPAFPRKPWPVTLGQLMGHLGGVRNDGGDEGPLLEAHCEQPVDGLKAFAERPLLSEPGTRFHYSSYGWLLVSAAIEAASGEPFLRVMRKQVFEPLGMYDTRADSATDSIPDRATSYFPRFAADPRYGPDPMRAVDYSCYAGASAFLSTPSDLVRFGMAMRRSTLLQPATLQRLQTSQRLLTGEETGHGLGWDLETVTLAGRQTRAVGHNGELLGGTAVSLMTLPELGLVVAVTSNSSYADTFDLATQIAEVFATRLGHGKTPD